MDVRSQMAGLVSAQDYGTGPARPARRLKVLVSAYACRPGASSEAGMAWSFVHTLAQHHDVWVVTRNLHQPYIERELAENPNPNIHFIFHELPSWCLKFK